MPLTQSWTDLEKTTGRLVFSGTVENIKQQERDLAGFLKSLTPEPSDQVVTRDGDVEGIKYRMYTPKGASKSLPLMIWAHGGGFVVGSVDQDDYLCRVVCEKTASILISVEYTLVPEARWPTQLNEVFSIYKWAHDNASALGGDPRRMFTAGGSAGGQLALNVCQRVIKDPALRDSIKGVVAMSPATCPPNNCPEKYKARFKSYQDAAVDNPVVDSPSMETFLREIGQREDDPEFWVLLATDDHKNFPPVYMVSCEKEPMRDDTEFLIEAFEEAGVPTRHDYYPGLPHCFWLFPNLPESQVFVDNLLAGVKWLQSQP